LYTKFSIVLFKKLSYSLSNKCSAKRFCQSAVAPRRHARPCAARHRPCSASLGVCATRRPRPRAGRGVPFPRRTPRDSSESPGASRRAPRRTGLGLAADRRSVGGTPPYARWPRWSCYGSISGVTATSRGGLSYKNPSVVRLRTPHRPVGRHYRRRRALASPLAFTAGQLVQHIP
jgi:hypothetical protein